MPKADLSIKDVANKTIVIKYGGSIMDNEDASINIIQQAVQIKNAGAKLIIVHGGGKQIERSLIEAGIRSQFIKGLRITSDKAMQIISQVLGEQNNQYIARLVKECGATPLSGKKTRILSSIPWAEKESTTVQEIEKLGRVGRIVKVKKIKESDSLAVVAPIAKDINTGLDYNVNADWAAAEIAVRHKADYLIYLTDQDGILDKDNAIIKKINCDYIEKLIKDKIIQDGMIPKTLSMADAIKRGVNKIIITNGTKPQRLQLALTDKRMGTLIVN